MTGNAFFPTPNPTLVKITLAATALQTAFDNAQGGGPAQTAVLHQKREAMETLLITEGHTVEDIANDPVNSVTGPDAIILSAGMDVKHFTPRQKKVFTAESGKLPGSVILTAEHVRIGTHEWQYSPDAFDSKAWKEVDPTSKATVTIQGLESAKRYFFRHRSVSKDGPSAWDGPIEFIVQ